MSTKGSRPPVTNTITKEYSRRSYIDAGDGSSYMDNMLKISDRERANQRKAAGLVDEPHSEMKKPYLTDDFLQMEDAYYPPDIKFYIEPWEISVPDGIIHNWNEETILITTGGGGGSFGLLTAHSPLYCDENIFGFASQPIGGILGELPIAFWIDSWNNPREGAAAVIDKGISPVFPLQVLPPNTGWYSWGDDDHPQDVLTLCVQFSTGNIACDEVDMFCYTRCFCDEEPPLTYYQYNPTEIGKSENKDIYVDGGCPPYGWSVKGTGFNFLIVDGTSEGVNELRANGTACGDADITVTDNCYATVTGTVATNIDCCDPAPGFSIDDDATSDTITAGGSAIVTVSGGFGPFIYYTASNGYTWSNGFDTLETSSREATLNCVESSGGGCGVDFDLWGDITVTDSCETEISDSIRNTAGRWSLLEQTYAYTGACSGGTQNCFSDPGGIEVFDGKLRYIVNVGYYQGRCNCETYTGWSSWVWPSGSYNPPRQPYQYWYEIRALGGCCRTNLFPGPMRGRTYEWVC